MSAYVHKYMASQAKYMASEARCPPLSHYWWLMVLAWDKPTKANNAGTSHLQLPCALLFLLHHAEVLIGTRCGDCLIPLGIPEGTGWKTPHNTCVPLAHVLASSSKHVLKSQTSDTVRIWSLVRFSCADRSGVCAKDRQWRPNTE